MNYFRYMNKHNEHKKKNKKLKKERCVLIFIIFNGTVFTVHKFFSFLFYFKLSKFEVSYKKCKQIDLNAIAR